MSNKDEKILNEKQILDAFIDFFHYWKKHPTPQMFDKNLYVLSRIIEKSNLNDKISINDIKRALRTIVIFLQKSLKNITDKEFINYVKSYILTKRKYHFYFPIFFLYNFPKNIKLGYQYMLSFNDLPSEIQDVFIRQWEYNFKKKHESYETEEKFIEEKKRITFLHIVIEANGEFKAENKAYESLHGPISILSFLYKTHFPINEYYFMEEGSEVAGGGVEEYSEWYPVEIYIEGIDKEISEFNDIITKSKPNNIELKIKNALRIFELQTSISNNEIRFILLVTCLESLLLAGSDKDYLTWRLAEKTAFLIGKNGKDRKNINDYIKSTYGKRSSFIHGETKKGRDDNITISDVYKIQDIVHAVFYKLLEFRREGYTSVKGGEDTKNIDEFIENKKFR
jgi:hypothetical protein